MEKGKLENFVDRFDGFAKWDSKKQVDYLAFFLMTEEELESFTAKQVQNCFDALSLKQYKRLAGYLSENAGRKTGSYVKSKTGYRLERGAYDEIKRVVDKEPKKVHVEQQLNDIVAKMEDSQEKAFLIEALNCYRVESYRASIVLVWILAIDHLQKYIFDRTLDDFNLALSKNPDKRVQKIVIYDDFSDLKETKFIELARASKAISNDVRKILDEKLGIRNSAAHPSYIVFSGHKTTEFIFDIVNNIILKY